MARLLALVLFLAFIPMAWAVQPDEVLPDAAQETRARTLSEQLRCLVCQNQSIDDSAAPLARDLRLLVRERIKAGDSDAAVKSYLVARYGDFILLKPPLDTQTLLLWGTPLIVLAAGAAVILAYRGRQGSTVEAAPLDAEEQARLDALTSPELTAQPFCRAQAYEEFIRGKWSRKATDPMFPLVSVGEPPRLGLPLGDQQ